MSSDGVGKIIEAEVIRTELYGVYLCSAYGDIIVLTPDASCERTPDLTSRFRVGERVRVKILEYVADRQLLKGSIKEAE